MRFFLVEPKSCFHAGDFVARRGAIASICRRPASLNIGLAFRWPISRARRQMRGDRIKCRGLRTYRTSCINATDSICRRARMESRSVVKLGQWARVDDKSNRSRSACGNATCGTFQHFQIAPAAFAPHCQQMTNVISFAPFDDHFGCGRPEIFPPEAVLCCMHKTTSAKPL